MFISMHINAKTKHNCMFHEQNAGAREFSQVYWPCVYKQASVLGDGIHEQRIAG